MAKKQPDFQQYQQFHKNIQRDRLFRSMTPRGAEMLRKIPDEQKRLRGESDE